MEAKRQENTEKSRTPISNNRKVSVVPSRPWSHTHSSEVGEGAPLPTAWVIVMTRTVSKTDPSVDIESIPTGIELKRGHTKAYCLATIRRWLKTQIKQDSDEQNHQGSSCR